MSLTGVVTFIKICYTVLFLVNQKKGDLLKAIWARYFRTTTTTLFANAMKKNEN